MSVDEAEEMVEGARKAGVSFGTAFMMRYQSQHAAALKLIQQGELGQPVFGRAQLSCWYPPIEGAWRQRPDTGGGGSLIDMGGHCIDLLEMFFGPVREVTCVTRNTIHSYPSEDSAVATLLFENGAIGIVDTFFCIPDEASKNVLELYGSRGGILASGTVGQASAGTMNAYLKGNSRGYQAQQSERSDSGISINPEPVNIYRAEIEEFSQALLEGRKPPVGGQAGIRSQQIISACYRSAREQRTVGIA